MSKKKLATKQSDTLNPMDPTLMKAFMSGRDAGFKTGKIEGLSDMMVMFSDWIEEMDQHVKGIGPQRKIEIELYLAQCIKRAVDANKLKDVSITIHKEPKGLTK